MRGMMPLQSTNLRRNCFSMPTKKKPKKEPKPEFQRTPEEQALVDAFEAKRSIPGVELSGETDSVQPWIEDSILWAAKLADITKIYPTGTLNDTLNPLAKVAFKQPSDIAINSGLGLLKAIDPQDGVEGLLAIQMVAAHRIGTTMAARAMIEGQTFEGVDAAVKRSAQMMRLFTKQIEALNAHRGKTSKQKVTVEHVHVHEGGQAIVGNVAQGGGGQIQEGQEPYAQETLTHAPEPTLQSQDAAADAVPVTGHAKRAL